MPRVSGTVSGIVGEGEIVLSAVVVGCVRLGGGVCGLGRDEVVHQLLDDFVLSDRKGCVLNGGSHG